MIIRVFLILVAWLLLLSPGWFSKCWSDPLQDGVSAYRGRNYARAVQLFAAAVRQAPDNPEALFYLGLSCAQQRQDALARQAFERVIQLTPPNSELAAKARNNITYLTGRQIALVRDADRAVAILRTAQSSGRRENYLTHVITQGKVIHFALDKMPLRVYIADGNGIRGWDGHLKQAVQAAMRAWQSATGGKISFIQTWTESNADIVVRWQRNFTDNILGLSPFQMIGNVIVRSDITLAVYYPDSDIPIPFSELTAIATHEMGHAIGLKGHSPYPGDIMYYSTPSNATGQSADKVLTQRDINTITLLYKLDADVRNDTTVGTAQTRTYFDWYEQGLKAQTGNRPEVAIACYRRAIAANGRLPEAKFNLGALLINEGNRSVRLNQLEKAQGHFAEALQLYADILKSPNPPESARENLAIARSNLALVSGALRRAAR